MIGRIGFRFFFAFMETKIIFLKGNIVSLDNYDIIVNPANSSLFGGREVDGDIHRTCGHQLLEDCKKLIKTKYLTGMEVGNSVLTKKS